MRADRANCTRVPCYGEVEPDTNRCAWNECPLQKHCQSAANLIPLTGFMLCRALLATMIRKLSEWIEP